jgi:hypothetical protein
MGCIKGSTDCSVCILSQGSPSVAGKEGAVTQTAYRLYLRGK